LEIEPNKLYIVVGPVGCGKSSLIGTILGETIKKNGSRSINGEFRNNYPDISANLAYTSQTAWLINGTLKDNILFGRPYEK
jgi:ABC-type transport system involved in cytochrome bd biosynthesis fused ATPase/permease subunit